MPCCVWSITKRPQRVLDLMSQSGRRWQYEYFSTCKGMTKSVNVCLCIDLENTGVQWPMVVRRAVINMKIGALEDWCAIELVLHSQCVSSLALWKQECSTDVIIC